MSVATLETLIRASSSSFASRWTSRPRSRVIAGPCPGQIPRLADRLRWHERPPDQPVGAELGQPGGIGDVFSELENDHGVAGEREMASFVLVVVGAGEAGADGAADLAATTDNRALRGTGTPARLLGGEDARLEVVAGWARVRLNAMTARTSQAAFALKTTQGRQTPTDYHAKPDG